MKKETYWIIVLGLAEILSVLSIGFIVGVIL